MGSLNEGASSDSENAKSEKFSARGDEHQHPDVYHKPKRWKEYFVEFLMIFLAVTLGFIAENFRQYLKDRAKEKQYIEGFIWNLNDDVGTLRHVIKANKRQVSGLDSLLMLAHANMANDSSAGYSITMFFTTVTAPPRLKVMMPPYSS